MTAESASERQGVLEVALAGCLHDIGKLLQRSGIELSGDDKAAAEILCPGSGGYPSHRHVLWTNSFIERYLDWLPSGLDWKRINGLASCHHRPLTAEHWIIAEADRIASGHDRREADQDLETRFREVPLHSILTALKLPPGGRPGPDGPAAPPWYPPDHDFAASPTPRSDPPVPDLTAAYRAVADSLTAHARAWRNVPVALAGACAWELSRRFCAMTTATAAPRDDPDVSLHDHAVLTAAFAAALYRYHRQTGTLDEQAVRDRSIRAYRIVAGDVSGIQDFIFAPPPEGCRKGMARMFRARSFYISMLTRAATIELLEAAGLPCFNRVIDAGGRFILLVDASPATLDALRQALARLQAWLVRQHYGALRLNIDFELTCSGGDFDRGVFAGLYGRIQAAPEAARARQLAAWLQSDGRWNEDAQVLRDANPKRDLEKAADLYRQLGKQLPRAAHVALFRGNAPTEGLLGATSRIRLFDLELELLAEPDPALQAGNLVELFVVGGQEDPSPTSWIPRLPLANYVPRQNREDVHRLRDRLDAESAGDDDEEEDRIAEGHPATFAQLAHLAEGAPMIAVLKADVDRLGMLFSQGLGDRASFGRIATLSRMLDGFFKEFLPARFADGDGAYRHVYTVFAGGDDLMLVGPWNVMMHLAADLQRWFRDFACGNPDVHLSAGLVFGKPRTPITSLGRLAEEQLDLAKDGGRNLIAVLGECYEWDQYKQALEKGRLLAELGQRTGTREGAVARGFLYQLLQIGRCIRHIERLEREGKRVPFSYLAWRSHLAYDFQRNVRDRIDLDRADTAASEAIKWLEGLLGLTVPRDRAGERILQLAATYALYSNRGGAR